MSTFTLQDLNLPMTAEDALTAIERHENMHTMVQVVMEREQAQHIPPQPTTKEQWMEYGMNNPLSAIHKVSLDAPEPQPTQMGELLPNPDLPSIINNICAQLQLLATVISQAKAQPDTTPPESLQETISLTLQQADWFQEMVRGIIDDTYDFADYAENAVEAVVEKEVEHYFDSSFNPEDHFDFGDAVSDAVDDRIDDIVSDKIDDAVDSYLSNATISISK